MSAGVEGDRADGRQAAAAADARSLLDRPLPQGYRADWARHFAHVEAGTDEALGGDEHAIVIFRIADEWLALSTRLFEEVSEPRRLHSLPHRRDALVLGIVNIRGELVVCVSLAALLGIGEASAGQDGSRVKTFPRMVVIGRDGRRVAFPVDEVHGIHRHTERDVVEVPATIGRAASRFAVSLISWQGRMVGRLDDALVLETLDRSLA